MEDSREEQMSISRLRSEKERRERKKEKKLDSLDRAEISLGRSTEPLSSAYQ